jgi:hypothetical protein
MLHQITPYFLEPSYYLSTTLSPKWYLPFKIFDQVLAAGWKPDNRLGTLNTYTLPLPFLSDRTAMGCWPMTLEQKPHDVGLGESRSVKLGESAPPAYFSVTEWNCGLAVTWWNKAWTPPTQYRTKEAGTTHQAKFLASTIHVQKIFTAIKPRRCVQSLTSVLSHGQSNPTSVSVGRSVLFIAAFYTYRIM